MKAAAFRWEAADQLDHAARAGRNGARLIAGGQSLGPMLNLRVVQPAALVSITAIAEICRAAETETHVIIGAGVTHAQIEDGFAPDIGGGILPRIAANIAYRAIRNRGTIGGSLCHADPAADWMTTLLALRAEALTSGGRAIGLADFFAGAFRTCLQPGEVLIAVRIPKLKAHERFGYYKACRKPGEFAYAMAAVVQNGAGHRVVIGAMGDVPLVLQGDDAAPAAIETTLGRRAPAVDEVTRHLQANAVRRAFARLAA